MKVRKTTLILLFVLMPMTITDYFDLPSFIDRGWYYLAFFSAALIALKYRSIYLPIFSVFIVQGIYYLFQWYSTSFSGGEELVDILQLRYFFLMMLTFMFIIDVYQEEFIRILNRVLIFCYTINLITIFIQAINHRTIFLTADEVYFVGYRYVFCAFAVVSLATSYYCRRFSKFENTLYKYLLFTLWLTALTAGPSTLLGGLIVYSAILFASKKQISIGVHEISLSTPMLVIGAVLVNGGIVFFNIQESFGFIIKTVLNREATFTGRSVIWETSIKAFQNGDFWRGLGNSLAFGYNGWGNLGWEEQKFSAHNQLLTFLTNTGVVGLAIEIIFFAIILRSILKIKETQLKYGLSASYVAMLIMSISTQLIPFKYIEIFAMVVIFISKKDNEGKEHRNYEYYSY